jgi:hypothetical protein
MSGFCDRLRRAVTTPRSPPCTTGTGVILQHHSARPRLGPAATNLACGEFRRATRSRRLLVRTPFPTADTAMPMTRTP